MRKSLIDLESGTAGTVVGFLSSGHGFKRRLRTRGIREGKTIRVVAKQPRGPVVVAVGGIQITLGRGMAAKVVVEVGQ